MSERRAFVYEKICTQMYFNNGFLNEEIIYK